MSTFLISKEILAAKPFFEQHIVQLIDRYCFEVPEGQTKKIVSVNLVKKKEGSNERSLAAYYEQLLENSKAEFERAGIEVCYRSFDWHKETRNGTGPYSELL